MGRANGARRVATSAALGGGLGAGALGVGVGALGVGVAVLRTEAALAKRVIGHVTDGTPDDEGRYGAGSGEPVRLLLLGDSTAKGVGAREPRHTVGAIVASGVAALSGRSVELTNLAVSGATSADLDGQVDRALTRVPFPTVALILVGANDVTLRLGTTVAVRHLAATVTRLRQAGAEVVVGTCPDLGVVQPIPQPLRALAQRFSRDLAAAQTVAVVEAGGRTVSLGDLLAPAFEASPAELFSPDRFHPSSAGYAQAGAALLPSICDAVGLVTVDTGRVPDRLRGETVDALPQAAELAVSDPGTEVSGTQVHGQTPGRRDRWALVLRRHRNAVPPAEAPTRTGDGTGTTGGLADRTPERTPQP